VTHISVSWCKTDDCKNYDILSKNIEKLGKYFIKPLAILKQGLYNDFISGAKWHKVHQNPKSDRQVGRMTSLTGKYEHSLDAKGRLSIPARIKEALGENFYVTIGIDNCLKAYPMPSWERLMSKFEAMSTVQKNKVRPLFSNAAFCELDGQGRILLPQGLREFRGLVKDVTIVGTGDTAEFWDTDEWKKKDATESTLENIAAIFTELDNL
jgi:MraZ protein